MKYTSHDIMQAIVEIAKEREVAPYEVIIRGEGLDGLTSADPERDIPTPAEIEAKMAEIEARQPLLDVYATRRKEYGSIGDQLDMLYHDAMDGTTTWRDHVAAVKVAHPKP